MGTTRNHRNLDHPRQKGAKTDPPPPLRFFAVSSQEKGKGKGKGGGAFFVGRVVCSSMDFQIFLVTFSGLPFLGCKSDAGCVFSVMFGCSPSELD